MVINTDEEGGIEVRHILLKTRKECIINPQQEMQTEIDYLMRRVEALEHQVAILTAKVVHLTGMPEIP